MKEKTYLSAKESHDMCTVLQELCDLMLNEDYRASKKKQKLIRNCQVCVAAGCGSLPGVGSLSCTVSLPGVVLCQVAIMCRSLYNCGALVIWFDK